MLADVANSIMWQLNKVLVVFTLRITVVYVTGDKFILVSQYYYIVSDSLVNAENESH